MKPAWPAVTWLSMLILESSIPSYIRDDFLVGLFTLWIIDRIFEQEGSAEMIPLVRIPKHLTNKQRIMIQPKPEWGENRNGVILVFVRGDAPPPPWVVGGLVGGDITRRQPH